VAGVDDAWNPELYERFAVERARPFDDLLALVRPRRIDNAVDLGCGTGSLTRRAAELHNVRRMTGLDSSPAMLRAAREHAGERVEFGEADIGVWDQPRSVDLVLANASLQWVDDHPAVLARWTAALRPGGQLAVQVPANADHASHLTLVEVASRPEWRTQLGPSAVEDPVARSVLRPEQYAELLVALGYAEHHVRLQVYGPLLDSPRQIVDWMRGTSLTRVQRVLEPDEFERFVADYEAAIVTRLGELSPYFFAFKRILMWGMLAE
jgi:trans-aconitate 2-methyltransferase